MVNKTRERRKVRPAKRRAATARRARRPRNASATREALLAAAAAEFERLGYAGARVEKIAAAARANKALIRYHFGGKQGLYNAVLREGLSAAAAELERSMAGTARQDSPVDRLERLIERFAGFYASTPDLALLITREQMDGARHLDRATLEALFAFFGTTRALLEEGIRSGSFRGLDPHHVHLALVGSLLFFRLTAPARVSYERRGLLRAKRTSPLEWSRHVEVVKSLLIHGLVLPKGEAGPGPKS